MHKNDLQILQNKVGSIPAFDDGCVTDDNIAIALATYFEGLPECPDDDVDDEIGWSVWAVEKSDDAINRIIELITKEQ